MGLKTKWNRFWTLRNTEGGFTLVELVVVIAILAILAGIAVPTYSGYIKKANEAHDYQLIAAINTAFGAACLEQGVEVSDVTSASIRLASQKVFGLSTFAADNTPANTIDLVSTSFNALYAGNENAVFKSEGIQSLVWNVTDSTFEMSTNSAPARITLNNGNTVTVSDAQVAALAASGLIDLGYPGIRDIVNDVYDTGEILVGVLGTNAEYFTRLSNAMVANGLMDPTEAEQISLALQRKDSTYSYDEAMTRAANALTLCGAIGVAESDVDTLMGIDFGSNVTGILNAYTSNGGTAATAAMALQYGVAANYAAQNADDTVDLSIDLGLLGTKTVTVTLDQLQNGGYSGFTGLGSGTANGLVNAYLATIREDPAAYMSKVQQASGYSEYQAGTQYQNDVNGMAAALGILGENVSNEDNVDEVINVTGSGGYLEQGMNSSDTQNLIETVLGAAAQSRPAN